MYVYLIFMFNTNNILFQKKKIISYLRLIRISQLTVHTKLQVNTY